MLYLLPLCLLVVLVIAVAQFVTPRARAAVDRRRRSIAPGGTRPGAYEWDRKLDQAARQIKGVPGPAEYRDAITDWLGVHEGVFVDAEGDAKRFELKEDAYLRELAKARGMRVFDASRVGYPERMRRRREGGGS
jgi:Ni/Co efflux regulator RcnB